MKEKKVWIIFYQPNNPKAQELLVKVFDSKLKAESFIERRSSQLEGRGTFNTEERKVE